MKNLAVIVALTASLAFAACGSDSPSSGQGGGSSSSGGTSVAGSGAGAKAGEPKIEVPAGPPPKRLVVRDLREGTGPALERPSDRLVVDYVGVVYETGEEFYNTWNRGFPSTFLLEEVHEGWRKGLRGMRAGGRRELIEPSRLAYGTGALIFVIDLRAVRSSETGRPASRRSASSSAKSIAKRSEPKVSVPSGPPPKRLVVESLIDGVGAGAREGDELAVRYVGVEYDTGEVFETSWRLTYRFELGAGEANEGWEEGLAGMRVGERRKLTVPPRLAPPGRPETLIYVVDLLAIN